MEDLKVTTALSLSLLIFSERKIKLIKFEIRLQLLRENIHCSHAFSFEIEKCMNAWWYNIYISCILREKNHFWEQIKGVQERNETREPNITWKT